ncbi:MAG: hypothetical protein M3R47_05740 [Chloroflexota bacterium]|nr:hypothetical protein [Chloroflexota bacterium]
MDNLAPLKSQDTMRNSRRFRWLAGALIVFMIIAATGTYTWYTLFRPCEVNAVNDASDFLIRQLKTYDHVYQVAVAASRTSPEHPVNLMKQIFMDTQQIIVPACMQTAKNELINYMGTVISAFQAFRAGEADATVLGLVKQSDAQYMNFHAELKAVNKCAPFCLPFRK